MASREVALAEVGSEEVMVTLVVREAELEMALMDELMEVGNREKTWESLEMVVGEEVATVAVKD